MCRELLACTGLGVKHYQKVREERYVRGTAALEVYPEPAFDFTRDGYNNHFFRPHNEGLVMPDKLLENGSFWRVVCIAIRIW